jgi:hypothetical protein
MRCPYCNKDYPRKKRFCGLCGTPLQTEKVKQPQSSSMNKPAPLMIQCPHCGEMHPTSIYYCPNIPGKSIEVSEPDLCIIKPASARRAKLILTGNDEILLTTPLTTLGRHDFARVAPTENLAYISKEHFQITQDNGTYYIEDNKSKNGTWLNSNNITGKGKQSLKDGDIIDIGNVTTVTFKTY